MSIGRVAAEAVEVVADAVVVSECPIPERMRITATKLVQTLSRNPPQLNIVSPKFFKLPSFANLCLIIMLKCTRLFCRRCPNRLYWRGRAFYCCCLYVLHRPVG